MKKTAPALAVTLDAVLSSTPFVSDEHYGLFVVAGLTTAALIVINTVRFLEGPFDLPEALEHKAHSLDE